MSIVKMENLIGVNQGHEGILGKFLYYSLSNVLIDREKLMEICESMNLPVKPGTRVGALDAFKSATGEVYDRIVNKETDGVKISKVYCRDNANTDRQYSRELVFETLGETTNRYKKLANISYDREFERFGYSVESYEPGIDIYSYCDKAADAFEVHKRCAGRNQVETMAEGFLNYMEALKISIHGRLFFVPKKSMHILDTF